MLTRRRVLLGGLLLVAVLLVGGRFLLRAGSAAAPAAPPIVGSAESGAGPVAAARLVVYVVGAVQRPGLYRLTEGARVADAVGRAGGATPKADLAAVNLAAPVADGQEVVVPRRQAASAGPAAAPGSSTPAAPVQLSIATVEQLDALPGIGPVTAQKIVDWRTAHGAFQSVENLDDVPGIGPARVEQLRDLVVP